MIDLEPFAYAYEYPVPFSGTAIYLETYGREINGSRPLRAIPLYSEDQIAELRARLAKYEGQITAEEMRERCAVIARAERHNREGSKSFFERGAISMSVHVEDAIRALSTKREEG